MGEAHVTETTTIIVLTDVAEAMGLPGPVHTAATVVLPSRDALSSPPVVVFGFPGGGYARGYYSFDMPGSSYGGQAGYHASNQGWIFVAIDPPGVGDSSRPDPTSLTFEAVVAANKATVESIMTQLEQGTVADGVGPVEGAVRIGLGQSLGGFYTIAMQGIHATFDAIAVLGWSAIHTAPKRDLASEIPPVTLDEAGDFTDGLRERSRQPGFGRGFHFEDVPREIVEADVIDYPTRNGNMPAWGSATFPGTATAMLATMQPGAVAKEAAAIRVPVFIGAGEVDLLPDPHTEPAAYASATDITVVITPRMAHMHNFAGTRRQLWDRIGAWGRGLAVAARADAEGQTTSR